MLRVAAVEPLMRPSSTSGAPLKYHWKVIGSAPVSEAVKVTLLLTTTD